MKQQITRQSQEAAVDVEFDKLSHSTSRFVDMGFITPVIKPATDYAKAIVDGIEMADRAIQNSSTYKESAAMDKTRAITDAQSNMSDFMLGLDEMVDDDGEPTSFYQKKVLLNEYLLTQKKGLSSDSSNVYNQAYINKTGDFAQTLAYEFYTQEKAQLTAENKSVGIQMITSGAGSLDDTRKFLEKRHTRKEATKIMLNASKVKIKQLTSEAILTSAAYTEGFYLRRNLLISSGQLNKDSKLVQSVMLDRGLNTEDAIKEAAAITIRGEDKLNGLRDPYTLLFNEVKRLSNYKGKDLDISLINLSTVEAAQTKAEVFAAKATLATLNKIAIDNGNGQMVIGDKPVNLATATEIIDNQASSTNTSSGGSGTGNANSTVKVIQQKYKAQAMDIFVEGNADKMDAIVRDFSNAGFDKKGGLSFIRDYTQGALEATRNGFPPSKAFEHLLPFSESRTKNPDIWGAITKDPRVALTMALLNKGFSDDKIELLSKNLSEVDEEGNPTHFSKTGLLFVKDADDLSSTEESRREDIDALIARSIIAPINRERYRNYFYKMDELGLFSENDSDLDDVLEEVEAGFFTNLGNPDSWYGENNMRVPYDFAKTRKLIADSSLDGVGSINGSVATTTFMAIEHQIGEQMRGAGFPLATQNFRDTHGNIVRVEGFDWDDISLKWKQISPGEYTVEVSRTGLLTSENTIAITINDSDIVDNYNGFKKKMNVYRQQKVNYQQYKDYLGVYAMRKKKSFTFDKYLEEKREYQKQREITRLKNIEANKKFTPENIKTGINEGVTNLWNYITGE